MTLLGDTPTAEAWIAVLDEAAAAGLLQARGDGSYALQPGLADWLDGRLRELIGEDGRQGLVDAYLAAYAVWATERCEPLRQGDPVAQREFEVEEANLLRALRVAARARRWSTVSSIVSCIAEAYEIHGRLEELRALREQLLSLFGGEIGSKTEPERADLQIELMIGTTEDALERNELRLAETTATKVLTYLAARSFTDGALSGVCQLQLGRIAAARQEYGPSAQRSRRALELWKLAGLEREPARVYHQLGLVAQQQRQWETAEQWFRTALELFERFDLQRAAGHEYQQLGLVALHHKRFDEAERCLRAALERFERLELERSAADVLHHLGLVAEQRRQLDEAEQVYRQALTIAERLRLVRDAGREFHQLGKIALQRGQHDEAERWYLEVVETFGRLGLERYTADASLQLGRIADVRKQCGEAEHWYRLAVQGFERLGQTPQLVQTLIYLGALCQHEGRLALAIPLFGRAYTSAIAARLPVAERLLIGLARIMQATGETLFVQAWHQGFTEQSPPLTALRAAISRLGRGGN